MTLPTRADGGIDYTAFAEKMGYSTAHEALAFMRFASAHTRERCARWHSQQENSALECGNREMATWHRLAAEKFRKEMED